jgi:hypothetical protein
MGSDGLDTIRTAVTPTWDRSDCYYITELWWDLSRWLLRRDTVSDPNYVPKRRLIGWQQCCHYKENELGVQPSIISYCGLTIDSSWRMKSRFPSFERIELHVGCWPTMARVFETQWNSEYRVPRGILLSGVFTSAASWQRGFGIMSGVLFEWITTESIHVSQISCLFI